MRSNFLLLAVVLLLPPYAFTENPSASCLARVTKSLGGGGALAVNAQGEVLYAHRADSAFIPASTLKIATLAAALHHWGPTHRFRTEFYLDKQQRLVIRGLGDPGLVSEEFPLIAKALAQRVSEVRGFVVDDSYFDPQLQIDGVGGSANPYDARNGALLVNFNTVFLRRDAAGRVSSAEPQTPLTPIAQRAGTRLARGVTERINLGAEPEIGEKYFVELLREFLSREGVKIQMGFTRAVVPSDAELLYSHASTKTLEEHGKALLEYSTNFLTNQIFLLLGAERFGAPATVAKGKRALEQFLRTEIGWSDFAVFEGAGLSRNNKVTPRQMIALLKYFERHRDLLAIEQQHFRAKTGSLRGVSTLAGYFSRPERSDVRFAILINDASSRDQRFAAAKALRACLL